MLYRISPQLQKTLKKLKRLKPSLFKQVSQKILQISLKPELGKPLGNILANKRRIHIDSYVLVYEISKDNVIFLEFEHHDKVYKKWKKN